MRNLRMAGGMALVLAVALGGARVARAQDVSVQMDNGAPFSTYKTYNWVNIAGVQYPNELMDMNIRSAIDSILKLKGMVKVDSNRRCRRRLPDLGHPESAGQHVWHRHALGRRHGDGHHLDHQ